MNCVKMLVFADFHYKKGVYPMCVEHLETILKAAHAQQVDYVIHAGDFCNDYYGSPEILNAYLNNPCRLPVYGVLGNHELEYFVGGKFTPQFAANPMKLVTEHITNRRDDVVWGTPDGTFGDGSIGYYYFDVNGIRMVCTDTNFSYSESRDAWEHNVTYHAPLGNKYGDALAPQQLRWLEEVLTDAAHKHIPCMVIGHAGYSGEWNVSHDHKAVREIYARVNAITAGTVLLSINGHYHTNRQAVVDNVLYFDVGTVLNGFWVNEYRPHYTDGHTFTFTEYDTQGIPIDRYEKNFCDLSMGNQTWFYEEPLYCIVTVREDGYIAIEGMKTDWIYGVEPPADQRKPWNDGEIQSAEYRLNG